MNTKAHVFPVGGANTMRTIRYMTLTGLILADFSTFYIVGRMAFGA